MAPVPVRPWWGALAALATVLAAATASPHNEGGGILGARRIAQANDCRGVVAFSGAAARPSIRVTNDTQPDAEDATSLGTKLGFRDLMTDKGLGWSRESGEFTCICPGLYQFAFSAAGPGLRLSLRKKDAEASSPWKAVVSTAEGGGGGAHVVLLDMEVGEVVAVWLSEGKLPPPEEEAVGPQSSFSGYRIAKK